MAIAVAEEGGIGIIDRGFRGGEIEPQVREVEIVKRKQHGVINDPYTIAGRRVPDRSRRADAHDWRRNAGGRRRPAPATGIADDARFAVRRSRARDRSPAG
jgi:IMP dehydrogenase/GMP reductase